MSAPRRGADLRADLVDAYLFRRTPGGLELLQLRRADEPLEGTWQPVMGHAEPGESAPDALWRELREETGLTPDSPSILGAWALEEVHPFFLARLNAVVLAPRFAVEVAPGWSWTPTRSGEHSAARWVHADHADGAFLWPGQRAAVRELIDTLAAPGSPAEPFLRLTRPGTTNASAT
ncbi:MAG: NUDIX domain-containing protein [Phycisphaeraceae bacterium]|nr:MAG: NUDIX domain-containing protein [Phycisphaeraceae bacterium]